MGKALWEKNETPLDGALAAAMPESSHAPVALAGAPAVPKFFVT